MRHARLVIHRLRIDDVETPVRLATLVAVDRGHDPSGAGTPRDEDPAHRTATVDWEVVAEGLEDFTGELGRVGVEMLCITGANDAGQLLLDELSGDAVVVRFVGPTVVLRGDGPLHGLTDASFES